MQWVCFGIYPAGNSSGWIFPLHPQPWVCGSIQWPVLKIQCQSCWHFHLIHFQVTHVTCKHTQTYKPGLNNLSEVFLNLVTLLGFNCTEAKCQMSNINSISQYSSILYINLNTDTPKKTRQNTSQLCIRNRIRAMFQPEVLAGSHEVESLLPWSLKSHYRVIRATRCHRHMPA